MKKEQVKEHFGSQAHEYEQLMIRIIPQYLEQHRIISDLLPDQDRRYHVLDLGCGNGVLSELVLRKYSKPRIIGFDITGDMLRAYEKKLAAYAGKFELKQGDFSSDPVGDGYDIILAGLTLHHLKWEQRKAFYKTLFAALNHGGIFISRDIIIDEDPKVAQDHYARWKSFMKSQGEDPEFWYAKHMQKDYPVTLSDHLSWLREAGFIRAASHWRLYNFAITSAEIK